MKWLIGIVTASVVMLPGCVTPTASAANVQFVVAKEKAPKNIQSFVFGGETVTNDSYVVSAEIAKARMLKQAKLTSNAKRVSKAVKALLNSQRKHRTWYAFSGSSPRGWDCSGLVLWTYQQIGVELPHRASEQGELGRKVNTKNGEKPKYGDIVVFKYKGSSSAYHVGIYLSKDKMMHAPRPGSSTRVESIRTFGGNYSKVSYIRVLEN
jgi:cell wall-associated NlpC family hydrolase